ncbi:class 1 isoprenoid biosynthesis enzyme [bacterium]|nr:class 1 isoprenoid biosynthesis enzyme [bacterium]MCB2178983.1 class 1 isoprenoid biosynthesis enzyme [bacterium]
METKLAKRNAIFSKLPIVQTWPEMETLFQRASKKNPHGWDLPILGCQAVLGEPAYTTAGEVALGCLQTSIILIDDMLDEEPNGYFRQWGHAQTANLAAAFQAAGLAVITHLESDSAGHPIDDNRIRRAVDILNEMLLLTAYGQKMDVENPDTEEQYWRVVHYKSTPYYRAGITLGAILAGATPQQEETIRAFGTLYGELIQLHDDLKDTMAATPNPDWLQKRYPLPILFASLVEHPQRSRFAELRQQIDTPGALAEAQQILIECGAVSYCLEQIIQRYRQGKTLLADHPLPDPQALDVLLEDLIDPVREVFGKLSIPEEEQAAIFVGAENGKMAGG